MSSSQLMNIDTNIFRYPEGSFFEKRSKTISAQTLRVDYGFSNEVTFNISIPFIELFSINQSFSCLLYTSPSPRDRG